MLPAALCLLSSAVCLFGKRPEVLSEMFCLGAAVHSGCLCGYRLKALIVRDLLDPKV